MSKISKIRELVVIFCVLILMKGIVSYAASATVLLHADQKSESSSYVWVPDNDKLTVWGNVSSTSQYRVQFIVPDSYSRDGFNKYCEIGETISPKEFFVINVSTTNLNLYGNSKDDQKKDCIASGGIMN